MYEFVAIGATILVSIVTFTVLYLGYRVVFKIRHDPAIHIAQRRAPNVLIEYKKV